jgi:hypothetical protein
MGGQEKITHGFTYIMQRKILLNNVGKTVSKTKIFRFILKGTVSRDFRTPVFFIKQYPLGP